MSRIVRLIPGFFLQRPDTELDVRRFAIASFKLGQENWPLLLRSCFLHDLASVQRLTLAGWFSGCAIRQQFLGGKWPGMSNVCVQCENERRPVLDDPNPLVATTVNPPLVSFGQAKPSLEIEIVLDLLELSRADEKPGQKADHQPGHVLANRIPSPLESIDQLFELLLAIRLTLPSGFERRGYLVDVLDVFSDRLLLGLDMLHSPVDAVGKTAELLFCEPPFFASKFRWIDSRTSFKASAMSRPGGWRGPPWSLLRIPRTAAQ